MPQGPDDQGRRREAREGRSGIGSRHREEEEKGRRSEQNQGERAEQRCTSPPDQPASGDDRLPAPFPEGPDVLDLVAVRCDLAVEGWGNLPPEEGGDPARSGNKTSAI